MSPRTAMTSAPLVITQGDPRGVGLELLLHLAADGVFRPVDRVIADPVALAARAATVPAHWATPGWAALQPLVEGEPGLRQTDALARGVDAVMERPGSALVTAPIDKKACQDEGFEFPGHTEYLAHRAGDCEVAMLMAGPALRVVLATIHLPLSEVARRLDSAAVVRAGRLLAQGLRDRFAIAKPRVAVLGLNPHAGERGMLGHEESTVIAPAVAQLRASELYASFSDPLPADTAFAAHHQGRYDGVVAMYHDQGLGPFKLLHFHDGVNVTLGLPFVRTSPDHGTALDIVGRGVANTASLRAAIGLARGETFAT
ncbi:MAG: 4-hydroxythreonine-4-phosphate dehydrogenase PdxA [Nannocystaceae bacterium]|nr:4-hydroxythreonine-4-phosphate dehydrogenase PdxA [Nannocystaceae bacterium]